jgi:hypothetical protein
MRLFVVTYFILFTAVNTFLGLLHLVDVNDVVDVSEMRAVSTFIVLTGSCFENSGGRAKMLMARLGTLCNWPCKSHKVHQRENHGQLIFPRLATHNVASVPRIVAERERSQWVTVDFCGDWKKNVKDIYFRRLMDTYRVSGNVVLYP